MRAYHSLYPERLQAHCLFRVTHEDGDIKFARARVIQKACKDGTTDVSCRSISIQIFSTSLQATENLPVAPRKKMVVFEVVDILAHRGSSCLTYYSESLDKGPGNRLELGKRVHLVTS